MPALILWAFDSRGTQRFDLLATVPGAGVNRNRYLLVSNIPLAGNTAGENSTQVPDWVDDSVAAWIEQETKLMDSVWGPPSDKRAAIAFVHIPPSALFPPTPFLAV